MATNFKREIVDIDIKNLIAKAAEIIAPIWPMQTIIARNPLQGMEALHFEDAIAIGETYLANAGDVNREMVKWCQVFLDEGQATITMPDRKKGFYRAWSLLAPFDRKLRSCKNSGWLLSLPAEPEEAIVLCLKRMAIPHDQIEEYLKYSLAELPGWAGYIKWRAEWQDKAAGAKNPITLTDFLAVRLMIHCVIDEECQKTGFRKQASLDADFIKVLKRREEKYLQDLLKWVVPEAENLKKRYQPLSRADAQIVFCIDVRSEPFRSRIEREGHYETFGFAGFFGLPISVRSYDTGLVKDCCPVIMKPRYEVFEEPRCGQAKRISRHLKGRTFLDLCRGFYQDLKYNFATPFALVETLGLWCGFWMAIRTLMPRSSVKFRHAVQEKLKPAVATLTKSDIPLAEQILYGETALKMMGLTQNFSRLVVFCGHGSKTENNPYASALDCGACGGNHGGPNGKILAAILNSGEVREGLCKRGIEIPDDTLFIGAEHNTTTDEVAIDLPDLLNSAHRAIVEKLKADFSKAGISNSQYRCRKMGLDVSPMLAKNHVLKRSSDWAEVRPEWGLARNAAFIIGPRNLTKKLSLDGRCFLHSYDWDADDEGKSLESILTGPMVVAEWINTQYLFSTLNNGAYGSGSKITHNVTGKFGVMQGNGSDLMQGLPLQSVNVTDDRPYHEPMRLQVIVYAPRCKIDPIIEKHPLLRTLVFNHWVVLIAIDPNEDKPYRLIADAEWTQAGLGRGVLLEDAREEGIGRSDMGDHPLCVGREGVELGDDLGQ